MDVVFDSERFWQILELGDPRFDGWVFCGVKTTGIYCRPSCPARTPKRENVRFFASAAAAQSAGFRACKRCRPDATPGSPDWDLRADLVGRAMRLIADGVVDREGVGGLAARLGYTERHVHRQLMATVGAGPLALARAQRAQTARILLETTTVPITGVAFAAGFQSVRQFNATVREVFAMTPRELRARAQQGEHSEENDALSLRLPYRAPLDANGLIAFLGLRAVPGIEEVHNGVYRRSLRLPQGSGVVELRPADGYVHARYWLEDLRDLAAAMQRSRALLDLDWPRRSATMRCSEDSCASRRDAGWLDTSTATSSLSAPYWASRCRSLARGRSPDGWSPNTGSRLSARLERSPMSSRRSRRLPRLIPTDSRCRPRAGARCSVSPGHLRMEI
jgi:AraC family transcriptional regulator of adaptative response / DNA-3-methyladenine glycosylase II